ncbi:MAG: sugar ABC transporter substrate-binding protein [Acidimicrobiales bacterium]
MISLGEVEIFNSITIGGCRVQRNCARSRGGRRGNRIAGVSIILMSGLLAACGGAKATPSGQAPAKASSSTTKTIEFIPSSNATPYFLDEYIGVKQAAAKYGYKTLFQAPSVSQNVSTQIGMVRTAVTRGVSGIILVPYSPTALVAPAMAAEAAHIPVIATDSSLNGNAAKTFIAVPDVNAAESVAKYAAKKVHGRGEYAIIDYNLSTTSGQQRRTGFETAMKKYPNMKFAGLQISNSVVQTALQETTTLIERNPGLNVVFGANDRSAIGAAEAVQRLHDQNKVVVVGFDADLGEINLIKSGVIKASALQSPILMGYRAVEALRAVWAGKTLPKFEPLPYHVVTSTNVTSAASVAAIQQYLPNYKG